MNSLRLITYLAATAATLGSAYAGGYSRGTADTDLIYEEGNFNMRSGVTVIMPKRGYATLTPPGSSVPVQSTDGDYSQTYAIPSAAVKFNLNDDLRCAGTYTQPFGADSEFGPQAIEIGAAADGTGTMREGFTTDEFGLTCGYKFNLAKGRAWLIGGGFLENFDYSQTVELGAPYGLLSGSPATLRFDGGYEPGFRLGAAYEIPEMALRAQLMYRSEVTHTPDGSFTTVLATAPAVGQGTLPQSLELKVQSGVAPGWLAFGTVKWTDWSVLDTLDYTIGGVDNRQLEYYYKDGWTVTGGLGHAFSESISGVAGFTWDRGVSTTEDTLSDTYTFAAGVALRDKLGGEVRFGGAITYLTAASVGASDAGDGSGPGNSFAYTVDGDFAYALSAGYKISW